MELELSSEKHQNLFVCPSLNSKKYWLAKRQSEISAILDRSQEGIIMDTLNSLSQNCLEKGEKDENTGQLKRNISKSGSRTTIITNSATVVNEVVKDDDNDVDGMTATSEKAGFKPPPTAAKLKLNEKRSRRFQRAFSCDIERPEEKGVEKPSRSRNNQEMEMTYVENDNEENGIDEIGSRMSHSDITTTTNDHLEDVKKGVDVDSGTLSSSDKDSGIVCSDEDLRFILTEVSQSRRLTVEAKREKMKSNRSLSLDSSFFKLHMKRLQADSPGWLSRILSQREKSTTNSSNGNCVGATVSGCGGGIGGGGGNATIDDSSSSSSPLISPSSGICNNLSRKRSSYKKVEVSPATITEDTTSFDEDSSSRRESNVSCGSDDERSLLLINNSESPVVNVPLSGTTVSEIPKTDDDLGVASKVVWNEGSVVDAEVLGTAIEFYLTSVNTQKTPGSGTDTCRPDIEKEHQGHSTNGVSTPVVSTLKGLFVK